MTSATPVDSTSCSSCGAEVGPNARFCSLCGAAIADKDISTCLACGISNPSSARFCAACGSHLSAVGDAERRIITVLFADLTGFTSLTERLDPEHVRRLVAGCLDPICKSVMDWGGFVDKFIGDCVMALFGAPVAYENEEERAIRAALDMQAALTRFREIDDLLPSEQSLQLRIGINTGPVVTGVFSGGGARNYTAVGDVVNVASRLQGQCDPGEVLVGSATYEQTRHVFEFGEEQVLQVKGKSEPVLARKVTGLRAQRGRLRGLEGAETPLIGRTPELDALQERWNAVLGGEFRHALLVGSPGIGKTRLVEELTLTEGIPTSQVAEGQAFPYASSTPWEPVANLVRDLHRVSLDMNPSAAAGAVSYGTGQEWGPGMVAALAVGLGAPADEVPGLEDFSSQEIVAQVTEALVKALSVPDGEPRLLVLEDLHWADNATLDLLATLPERMRGTPAFLLMVARTPLPGETRLSALLQAVGEWIDVKPLRQEESYRLVYALLGEHGLPERFLNRTVGRAEGNPMFIEELVKVLKDRGIIVRRDGAWEPADDLDDVQIPDTVESLLSTRIDALGTSTKRVLQYAAIVGRRFWSGVLRDVLVKQPVDSELGELMHSQIVRSLPESVVEGDREFLFQNLLLQEVAYEGLLRGLRSELHGAVARWLESELHDQNLESQELIAFHFERSPTPGAAGPYLRAAADRAQARGAQGDALTLVRRALAVAEPDERLSLLLMAEEIASSAGDRERWDEALADLEAELSESPDPGLLGEFAFRKGRRLLIQGKLTAARAAAQEALSALEAGEVTKRMADVHALFGRIQHQWGNYPSAREHYQTALAIHRETGDVPGELDLMDKLGLVEVDLDDFCRAVEIFDGVLERLREGSHHFREARVLAHRATALRWLGRYEEAESNAREALDLAQRTGSRSLVASALMTLGFVLAAADAPRAQETLARAARAAEGVGRPALEARVWLSLADLDTGREAEGHAARAQELASRAGLVHIDILARSRLAELALEARRIDEADRLSGSAMRRLERHGSIQGPEEVVVWVRARVEAAMGNARRAAELWEEARSLLAEKAARIPNPDDRRRFLEGVEPNPAILEGLPAPVGKGEME